MGMARSNTAQRSLRKPVDMSKASGVLFYNVVNRGNKGGPATWDVGGDPGDGSM